MELTNEIIDRTYKCALGYLRKRGRKDIDFRDVAHEVFCRLAKKESLHADFIGQEIYWIVKNVFRDLYTNTTKRKKDVMHEAWRAIYEDDRPENCSHEDLVDASEDCKNALKQVYLTQKNYFDLLVDFRTMEAIAQERQVSPQAIHQQKQQARQLLKSFLGNAA
jgi:DNA-directed RNA polymerase specialized sigma24 family protein